jgi:hypothetical protein
MSIIDRVRELFGGKQSGAESSAASGGVVAATAGGARAEDDAAPDSGSFGGDSVETAAVEAAVTVEAAAEPS